MMNIAANDPLGAAVMSAIHSGDFDTLKCLLNENPHLSTSTINDRSLLHVVADWPGHFPSGAAVVNVLIAAGCDPNARVTGKFPETPLHWAASCDDVDVLDALLDGGADIEASGASIAGGTALDDAVGYGQWRVARRLVERGARVEKLWHAAALGIMPLIEERFARESKPTPEEKNDAFWQACHGGQLEAAEYLLARGADLNWVPDWTDETPLDIARSAGARDLAEWLRGHGARSSKATG
jgi:ankyrin repeat protein